LNQDFSANSGLFFFLGFLDCSLDCTFVKRTGSIHSLKSSSGVRLVECSNRAQFLLLVAVEAGRPQV
jgi:hypothetical protein